MAYEDPFVLEPPRLSRPSVRKAVRKRALFEFHQGVGFGISRKDPERLLEHFLERFDRATSIDTLLATGRDHRDAILEVLNWQTKIHYPPDSFQGAAFKSLDSSRFLTATEWQPRIGLQDGIKRVLEAEYQVPPR